MLKRGFTLAEVLITLGIIGVVAAMTLPALTGKYQSKVLEVAFKKQYSVLQNAFDYSALESGYKECYTYLDRCQNSNGTMVGCYKGKMSDCPALQNDIIAQLKLKEISTKIRYATKQEVMTNGGTFINATCTYDYYRTFNPYTTKDGAFVYFAISGKETYPTVVLDVNGEKGPNKWGYDVYFLTLSNREGKTDKIQLSDQYCSMIEKGGRFPRKILAGNDSTTGLYN